MMEPNGPPASAFETAAIEPRKIAPTAAQCFMPAPAKTRQYYCELQSECKVSFCSQRVWGPKNGEPPERYAFLWLAEREGFEPPIGLHLCRISSAVHSTTLPPLRCHEGADE